MLSTYVVSTYVLSCYPAFHCIADRCRHTCCRGWEIDIDDDTAALYEQADGAFGDRLRASMARGTDGRAVFRLTEDERCPMLREDGLCELILQLGEDALCDICAMHPRFCHDMADRTEIGLGLACEEATRLTLTWQDRLSLVPSDNAVTHVDDSAPVFSPFGAERDRLIGVMQDRRTSVFDRMAALAKEAGVQLPADSSALARFMAGLETMDPVWTRKLNGLKGSVSHGVSAPDWETALEQLGVVLLFRHLPPDLPVEEVPAWLRFVVVCWMLVVDLTLQEAGPDVTALCEVARIFSSEIEYSDENPGLIAAWAASHVPESRAKQ